MMIETVRITESEALIDKLNLPTTRNVRDNITISYR